MRIWVVIREMQNKIWVHKDIPENEIDRLSAEAGISRLLAKVFVSRGVLDVEYVKDFLNPKLDGLHDPFLLMDMDAAVCRIMQAVECNERIVIYGDYDVDGVTSTSMLYNYLVFCRANVEYYIPDRIDEGYGLSINAIDKVVQMGVSLLITVDCGITAVDEVDYINNQNIQVIITDHHECKNILPGAYAIINPCRPDCTYPFKELAGVGVVFKLVHALCLKMKIGDVYKGYLDLAALGTVADVVPLTNENRIIVKYGLSALEKSLNPGIKALVTVAGLKDKPVTSYGVGFALAPRINAAGRIGNAVRAVKLFTTADRKLAEEIAVELNEENRYRQETEMEIIQQVNSLVETGIDLQKEKIIIVSGKEWHHGIIGIVASKITERYHRPCILVCEEKGMCKGSGRSIEGFNLFLALMHCENLLEKFGGHEMAAGLSLKTDNFDEFKKLINEYADSVLTDVDLIPCIKIDAFAGKEDITIDNVRELELLAPFGSGNPGPVFAYDGLRIADIRTVGENKHLKLKLEDNGLNIDAIGFNMGEQSNRFFTSNTVDSVFTMEINVWNNSQKVQINLKDIRLHKDIVFDEPNDYNINNGVLERSGSRRPEEIIPERADLAAVYQCIRAYCKNQPVIKAEVRMAVEDMLSLAALIADRYRVCMNHIKLGRCIEIFEELNLLKKEPLGESGMVITFIDAVNKTNLEDSSIYRKLQESKNKLAANDG